MAHYIYRELVAMPNLQREVWEGWTVQDFIDELSGQIGMIMCGESWHKPFQTKEELARFIKENQPYYKKTIPEVNSYFAEKYWLR
jgi:hypothetical protein